MDERLWSAAAAVLTGNDAGGWTRAAPQLYPHQWSWDSAFVAVGWAHLSVPRALTELRSLFAGQWANGMVPHIVYDPAAPAEAYFPDAARWGTGVAAAAPDRPTSGICQPPVHALALAHIAEVADRARGSAGRPGVPNSGAAGPAGARGDAEAVDAALTELYPKVLAWHRYLATERDPQGSGLVSIYHPWESGTDNSPRFDVALARVEVGDLPPYRRRDTGHVADPAQRPSDTEYDRYLWLVELLRRAGYADDRIAATHPFVLKDVLFSAILVAANDALGRIAARIGAPAADRAAIAGWRDRGRAAVDACWDPRLRLCLDQDVRAATPVRCRTVAGFAGLVAGGDRRSELVAELTSPRFAGDPRMRWPVPPSTSPADPAFRPRTYWRGPSWPVLGWLLWRSLGEHPAAAALRAASLEQVRTAGFAEYVEPFTGEPLGSPDQSWTAAVTLDWLAAG
ncbi:glucosylglycerate hydrolase [Actinocatenispora sera]|uniref:Mannosylglycerate hydrolase MGH1-like glycoside hydrolase domain-containing protein n=1 Tax=Actinocatenispora sera TaxID=390989 RepID=A0A810L6T8_9ACTN|nr:hypothetical protein [Actinocatenispora sera]BCJ30342.1 hypothetical protein Asera_44500 [Actinocatenispora sera]